MAGVTYDCVVRGGTVVLPEKGVCAADLAVADGRVAALLSRGAPARAREEIDASGLHVLPGLIDPHAHLELGPGEHRYAETGSAAIGGVTTVMTYVATAQPFGEVCAEERRLAARDAVTDVVIHLGVASPRHLDHIGEYVEKYGLTSFKHFMHFKGAEGAYMGGEHIDDGHLHDLLLEAAKHPGVTVNVHAENIEVVWRTAERVKQAGRGDLAAYSEARPDYAEAEKIAAVMVLAAATGARVYFVHVTSALSIDVHRRLRSLAPDRVFVETCPHYLTHTQFSGTGVLCKVNPPVRGERDVEALWAAVADGTVHTIGSDHVPRRLEKKQGDVWEASAGFPGTATILPVLLSEGVHRRGLPLSKVVALTSYNPARIFGLYPRKGTLLPGSDADFTLVDLDAEKVVSAENLGSYADYSIYDGWSLTGWPVRTVVRGTTVMENGKVVASAAGHGRLLNGGDAG